jgi:7-cyano-7-deazaguanine synthase
MNKNKQETSSNTKENTHMGTKEKAVILLSGGLDSATVMAIAQKKYDLYALSFLYGQRHSVELEFAEKIASKFNAKNHQIAKIDLGIFGNSSLTDKNITVPKDQDVSNQKDIPTTYVPARNTIFLSFALAYAEVNQATNIFIGANAVDYSNYPDCRPEFIQAFENLANKATASQSKFKIHAPLINLTKSQIIQTGLNLGVDYSTTHSCYDPVVKDQKVFACAKCDSCLLRLKGFQDSKTKDPYPYV